MLDRSNTYLIPLEQVVCDFGSVVARGLIDDRERNGGKETRETRRLARDLTGWRPPAVSSMTSYPVWLTDVSG